MALFQSAAGNGKSISLKTMSIMPSRRSSLLTTCRYSAIGAAPRSSARLRMLSDSKPPASARATAAWITLSLLSRTRLAVFAVRAMSTPTRGCFRHFLLTCVHRTRTLAQLAYDVHTLGQGLRRPRE